MRSSLSPVLGLELVSVDDLDEAMGEELASLEVPRLPPPPLELVLARLLCEAERVAVRVVLRAVRVAARVVLRAVRLAARVVLRAVFLAFLTTRLACFFARCALRRAAEGLRLAIAINTISFKLYQ